MLQGHTTAIVPCGNPTPKKLPTGGGEWPTFRTAHAQRAHSARYAPLENTAPHHGVATTTGPDATPPPLSVKT